MSDGYILQVGFCSEKPNQLEKCWHYAWQMLRRYNVLVSVEKYYDQAAFLKILQTRGGFQLIFADGQDQGFCSAVAEAAGGAPVFFLTMSAENRPRLPHVTWISFSRMEQQITAGLLRQLRLGSLPGTGLITVYQNRKITVIAVSELICMERSDRKTNMTTTLGDYCVTPPLDHIMAQTDDPFLVRCHSSYCVNLRYVRSLEKNRFTLTDGRQIYISRKYLQASRKAFFAWIRQNQDAGQKTGPGNV